MYPTDDIEHVYIGFNRMNFIREIFEPEFNCNVRNCAEAMGLKPNYLRDIIMSPTRDAGTKTLSCIYRYCIKTGKEPERFIFVKR